MVLKTKHVYVRRDGKLDRILRVQEFSGMRCVLGSSGTWFRQSDGVRIARFVKPEQFGSEWCPVMSESPGPEDLVRER